MSEIPLAQKYSPETFDRALSNLIERWRQEGGEDPIKYDEAAVGMDKSTVSVSLKFLGEIGLLDIPKAGHYTVPEEVVNYKTKMGDVKKEAKQEVTGRLEDYPLYKETKFLLRLNDFTLDELAEDVSGNPAVAAEQDELNDVKRSLRVLAELGFLEIDDEGGVSIPADLEGSSESEAPEAGVDEAESGGESEGTEPEVEADGSAAVHQPPSDGPKMEHGGPAGLSVDIDISMDVTEMEADEIEEKLEAINGALE